MTGGPDQPSGPTPNQPATSRTPQAVPGFAITVSLRLPRHRASVRLARHLAGHALCEAGADAEDVADVQLALTEACANVVEHSGPGGGYDVTVTIGAGRCDMVVADPGPGFHHKEVPIGDPSAERGRGLVLMRAVMDAVEVMSEPEQGTLVTLRKAIAFEEGTPGGALLAGPGHTPPAAAG